MCLNNQNKKRFFYVIEEDAENKDKLFMLLL